MMTDLQELLQKIDQLSLDELLYLKEYILDREKYLLKTPARTQNVDEAFTSFRQGFAEGDWEEEEE